MNNTAKFEFTIIVPVYNEQDNILRLESELSSFLKNAVMRSCVMFIDDGSKDDSGDMLKEVCERHDNMFYLSFSQNAGLSAAIKAGIDYTCSEYVGYIDADLQTAPEDFNLLLTDAPDYAMVIGVRIGRKDGFVKRASSKFANGFRRMMTHDDAIDTGCPLKVIKTENAKKIPLFTGMHRFLPALVMLQNGGTYKQIPVRHFPRIAGQSKFHLWNRLIGPLKDCFAYRWMKKRYINYSIESSKI
ncbi:MAG: glycosyltransferase [Bacteroidales bacterium]|jgi:glycosyltransferase involved in cell wall biosynthesis|nr:glycosyltransferase [Bacteroidales bacterium]